MRAGIYVRVSTAEQAIGGFSLDAQVRAGDEYSQAHGLQAEVYRDEGISAAHESASQRPGFRRLLEDVEAKRIGVVIVHKLDRFSRNLVVTIQSLARIEKAGASFVSLTENIDMITPGGRLTTGMFAVFAQFYSDNLATEVSKGRQERALQGLPNGDLPFGYLSTGNPRNPPALVAAEATLVRAAFTRYASGTQSAHQIAGWLNSQRVPFRSKRGSTRFTKATVMGMLSNPFYKGSVRYRGDELPGRHEACVDPELFDRTQRVRMSRRRMAPALKAHPLRTYMLQGIGHCLRCGHLLTCNTPKAGPRYRDTSRDKHQPCEAHRQSVVCNAIDAQIGEFFRRLELPEDWADRLHAMATESGDSGEIEKQRRSVKDRLKRLSELYLDGELPKARYEQERASLRGQLESLDAAAPPLNSMEEAAEMIRCYNGIWDAADESEKAAITKTVFEEVYVDLDSATVRYVKPRAPFLPLFRVLWQEKLLHGDPEQIRTADLHLDRVAC